MKRELGPLRKYVMGLGLRTGTDGLTDHQRIDRARMALRSQDATKALLVLSGRTETAFLLATMDVHTQKIIGVDIYSDDTPRQNMRDHRLFTVTRVDAATFAEARKELLKVLAAVNQITGEGWYDWALPMMRDRESRAVKRVRAAMKEEG